MPSNPSCLVMFVWGLKMPQQFDDVREEFSLTVILLDIVRIFLLPWLRNVLKDTVRLVCLVILNQRL